MPHCHVGAASAFESFGGHDLVIMTPQIPAFAGPRTDVVAERDGLVASDRSLRCPDAPVLPKSFSTFNRRRVGSLDPIYIIGATVTVDGTL